MKINKILAGLNGFSDRNVKLHDVELFAFVIFQMIIARKGGVMIVVENSSVIDEISEDIRQFLELVGEKREFLEFPEFRSGKGVFQPDNDADRNLVLAKLLKTKQPSILLTTVSAFCSTVSEPKKFLRSSLEIKVGDKGKSPEEFARLLVELDYDNEYQVTMPGEFARRGGILDIYSMLYSEAHRLEFFGDEVESIRLFDPQTQKSLKEVKSMTVVPRSTQDGDEGSLMDYCENYSVILVDNNKLSHHLQIYFDESEQKKFQANLKCSPEVAEITVSETEQSLPVSALAPLFKSTLAEIHEQLTAIHNQFVLNHLEKWTTTGCKVVIFCESEGQRKRLEELLENNKKIDFKQISFLEKSLSKGIFLNEERLVLLSQNEIFGRSATVVRRMKSARQQALEAFLEAEPELAAGDYAVHLTHGICRFEGVQTENNDGILQEVMVLEFADEKKLYVPLESAHMVTRYIGGRKGVPTLSKLGSNVWRSAREKAFDSATELAAELLRIQAVRKHSPGHRFARDNNWQEMFESAFPYKETEDQLKAIEAVKKDMESPQPMDRLICGDVGFGKTEVAIRAAFKAVMDEKQVAIIVPTTILAQQHFRNFSERMADYPVDIRLLCRFVGKKEQDKTLDDMAEGACDIVIGTHRLLQNDIKFNRLGLIIIDEEQRFGVEHKERLKRMRATVDILTMTATPIPRTLYFSLAGLRDFSTIITPPMERKPVKTIVSEENDELVREAILRELERGGQVYLLHNRVQTIEKRAFQIKQLVPEARVIFGHGQMSNEDLEDVMQKLLEKKCDVLVSTTIIESGLDNPDANTIIIDRADMIGLAELYQLRGRVGRYHHQAYCYLMLPKHGVILETARQRLAAIRKYTHLGAGFKLALRDLEIRGAGNLLGKEQSGHIAAVGFELYCKLLKQSVETLENKTPENDLEIQVNFDFMPMGKAKNSSIKTASLTEEYISSETVRLELYKRAAKLKDLTGLDEFEAELKDRFGEAPETVENFLKILRIKLLAHKKKFHSITSRNGSLYMESENGYFKWNGKIPTLSKPENLEEVITLLKKI